MGAQVALPRCSLDRAFVLGESRFVADVFQLSHADQVVFDGRIVIISLQYVSVSVHCHRGRSYAGSVATT